MDDARERAAEDGGRVAASIGPRLRNIRTRRGLTLADLERRTGISTSTWSRLESGGRRATIELLLPLARAYGVTLDELVGAPETGDPRVHIKPTVRHGVTYIPLTRNAGGVRAYKLIYPPADPSVDPADVLVTHDGYEWVYVLSGRLRLLLGDRDTVLEPGEAAEFDTHVPHWLGSAGGATEVLSLFGSQGERAHVKARTGRAGR